MVCTVPNLYRESLKIPKGKSKIGQSKNRQHDGQKKRDKRTTNDLQSKHIELKIE